MFIPYVFTILPIVFYLRTWSLFQSTENFGIHLYIDGSLILANMCTMVNNFELVFSDYTSFNIHVMW